MISADRQIHRTPMLIGQVAFGPFGPVTFDWQADRQSFSIWHHSGALHLDEFLIVPTGSDFPEGYALEASRVIDSFHVFHLLRKRNAPMLDSTKDQDEARFWKKAFEEAAQCFDLAYWNNDSCDGFNCRAPAKNPPSEVPTLVEGLKRIGATPNIGS